MNLYKIAFQVCLTLCIILIIVSFICVVANSMSGLAICFIGVILFGFLTNMFYKKNTSDLVDKIKNDPAYAQEKEILTLMDKGSKRNAYLEAGVPMMFSTEYNNSITDYLITSRVVFCPDYKLVNQLDSQSKITLKEFTLISHTYGKKNASVAGRAAAGAVIGGAAGAVVGAVSAASTNASGGVSKTYSHNEGKNYILIFDNHGIKTVYFSKFFLYRFNNDFYSFLKENFTLNETNKNICIEILLEQSRNKNIMTKLQDYLVAAIEELKKEV